MVSYLNSGVSIVVSRKVSVRFARDMLDLSVLVTVASFMLLPPFPIPIQSLPHLRLPLESDCCPEPEGACAFVTCQDTSSTSFGHVLSKFCVCFE